MALDQSGAKSLHAVTVTTAAHKWGFTRKVRQVRVTNRAATALTLYVTVASANTLAGAEAAIVTAVADADETIAIMQGQTKTVWQSGRGRFVAGSVVSTAACLYTVEGFENPLPN